MVSRSKWGFLIFCKLSVKVKSLILNVNKGCAVWENRGFVRGAFEGLDETFLD